MKEDFTFDAIVAAFQKVIEITQLGRIHGLGIQGGEIIKMILNMKLLETGQFRAQGSKLLADGGGGGQPTMNFRRRLRIAAEFRLSGDRRLR